MGDSDRLREARLIRQVDFGPPEEDAGWDEEDDEA
jgi:hypothetical protein